MKKIFVAIISALLFGCSIDSENTQNTKLAKGEKHYGGTLFLNENDPVASLFPLHLSDAVSSRISSQIYEGLFKLNPQTLEPEKCLISNYTLDSTHTLYTFTLKDSIFFHDNRCFNDGKGRQLTSDDIIYCFSNLCKYSELNHSFSVFNHLVEGANEYYELSKKGKILPKVSGLNKINELTLTIKLTHPSTLFTNILSERHTYIYPREYLLYSLEKDNKQEVGTGPFKMISKNEDGIRLEKNIHYHMKDNFGNKLPFLDALEFSFIENKHIELDSFMNLNTDVIYRLPSGLLMDLHMHQDSTNFEHEVTEMPEMAIDYIGFNLNSKPYTSINLRKAIAFALNKKKILEIALDGEADEEGKYGITPPIFKKTMGYPVESVSSYLYDTDSAKYYLELSQVFSENEPRNLTLFYNLEGHRNDLVVNTISRELKEILNIDLLIKPLHQTEYSHAIESGEAKFFLSSWIYAYPHPQEHLAAFYSSGNTSLSNEVVYPDVFRYSNPQFNSFYEKAFSTEIDSISTQYYVKAEQILINDLPIIPLWYDEGYLAKQTYVKDFYMNAIEYRDLRYTFIQPHDVISPEQK